MHPQTLTARRLRELVEYSPDTGVFTRRVTLCGRALAGSVAGGLHQQGYITFAVDGVSYQAHRLAFLYMTGEWPQGLMDHIDGVRHNNRWANLRDVSPAWNAQNRRKPQRQNKSGLLGVASLPNGRFVARVVSGKKRHFIGEFASAELAHHAYMAAKRQLHAGCAF
jgi:hypothetical protein